MEGCATGPLRLWRFEEEDLVEGNTYIVRGLKVTADTHWDDQQWKYVPRQDGTKALECTTRAAVEDVTHVDAIAVFFHA